MNIHENMLNMAVNGYKQAVQAQKEREARLAGVRVHSSSASERISRLTDKEYMELSKVFGIH